MGQKPSRGSGVASGALGRQGRGRAGPKAWTSGTRSTRSFPACARTSRRPATAGRREAEAGTWAGAVTGGPRARGGGPGEETLALTRSGALDAGAACGRRLRSSARPQRQEVTKAGGQRDVQVTGRSGRGEADPAARTERTAARCCSRTAAARTCGFASMALPLRREKGEGEMRERNSERGMERQGEEEGCRGAPA